MVEGGRNNRSGVSQAEEDIAALSAFLKSPLEQARRGELSTKTFDEIREGAKAMVSGAIVGMSDFGTEIDQREMFCQFLDDLLTGRCGSENWQKNIITHYKDAVLETARSKVSKTIHPDCDFENLSSDQIAEIKAVRRSLFPSEPLLTGTLGEAFRISGHGTVLIVENYDGDMPSKGRFQVGEFLSKITGVDFPRKTIRKDDGTIEVDKSMIGICIEDDVKEQLLEMKGQPVEVFEL